MQLVRPDEFADLLSSVQRSAFHLEVQDSYLVDDEDEHFAMFLAGEVDDYAWMDGWSDLVRSVVARGCRVERARVVTVPHSDYIRWSLEVSRVNIAAGEDIRYLPRHEISPDLLTAEDWWLFDDERVGFTAVDEAGRWVGTAVTDDPKVVDMCAAVRANVWAIAIPHGDYLSHL